MKSKLTTIAAICVASLLLVLMLTIMIAPTFADTPNEPHPADSMWVEPSNVTFDNSNASVGTTKFNVTVWLNITEDVFTYQIGMLYNHTQLLCTRSGYTGPTGTSMYFSGHTGVTSPSPVIDTSFLGNGSILATETCQGTDNVTGPHSGSLIWAEFQIVLAPTGNGNLTSMFDIATRYSATTWVKDPTLTKIDLSTPGNAQYVFIVPEFLLILPIFMALTLCAAAVSRKKLRKS